MNLLPHKPEAPGQPRVADGKHTAGFTMVEIALCLAIIGFALVAIIGVLPTGLNVQKDNREATVINLDAAFLLDTIRNGSRGQDDLTNFVIAITNRYYIYQVNGTNNVLVGPTNNYNYYTTSNYSVGNVPHNTSILTNGFNIIGLLTTPKYTTNSVGAGQFRSNYVSADFRGISGSAIQEATNQGARDFAFSYRLEPEIVAYGENSTAYDPSWINYQAPGLPTNEVVKRYNASLLARNLHDNLNLVRLRFRWPVLPNGRTGVGRQVFRTFASGAMTPPIFIGKASPEFYFIQSKTYTNVTSTNAP